MLGNRSNLSTPIRTFLTALLAGLVATTGWAQGLPTTAPSAVGLSEERLDRLEAVVQRYVDEQAIAGAVSPAKMSKLSPA